eukprot:gene4823-6567_t
MVLNQLDLPVRAFAWPMTLALAAFTAAIFVLHRQPRHRLAFPARALAPFFGVALFSLLWTGWPALRFNFSWLSYVNDDYVNYCFAAERFKDFGFWRVPTMEELAGRDWSQYYWFMHVPGLMRFGSEHVLAWISALTGVKALGVFMPVILGFGLVQLFAAAALALHLGRWRRRALIGAAILAASPLFMLGMLYQLIAQVGGLALLLASTAVLTARLPSTRRRLFPHILVLSIIGAAFAVFYPEVTAFAVLTTLIVGALEWIRTRAFPTARLGLALSDYETVYGVPTGDDPATSINLKQKRLDLSGEITTPFAIFRSARARLGLGDYDHAELSGGSTVNTLFANRALEGRLELPHLPLPTPLGDIA